MIQRFAQSANYVRVRAALGVIYLMLGAVILIRTCTPLSGLLLAKIPSLALGAALIGLGIIRMRDFFLLLRENAA